MKDVAELMRGLRRAYPLADIGLVHARRDGGTVRVITIDGEEVRWDLAARLAGV